MKGITPTSFCELNYSVSLIYTQSFCMSTYDHFACAKSTVKIGLPKQGDVDLSSEECNLYKFLIPLKWV